MIVSIFEVAGPIMVGPSSSHTAGAARLSRLATLFLNQPFRHVSFGLHGSFARTYHGHGTDLALVAGALGIRQEDEEMKRAFQIAQERGITYDFYPIDLGDAHENSVAITFTLEDSADNSTFSALLSVTALANSMKHAVSIPMPVVHRRYLRLKTAIKGTPTGTLTAILNNHIEILRTKPVEGWDIIPAGDDPTA